MARRVSLPSWRLSDCPEITSKESSSNLRKSSIFGPIVQLRKTSNSGILFSNPDGRRLSAILANPKLKGKIVCNFVQIKAKN